MKAAGVDPVELERSRIEKAFTPYLLAQGDRRTPTQITLFGLTGGFERWHVVWIKKGILEFSDQDQLAKLPILMTEYRQRYKGLVPFFGSLTRFVYVRYRDYFIFDADGQFIEHVGEPFRQGACRVELR